MGWRTTLHQITGFNVQFCNSSAKSFTGFPSRFCFDFTTAVGKSFECRNCRAVFVGYTIFFPLRGYVYYPQVQRTSCCEHLHVPVFGYLRPCSAFRPTRLRVTSTLRLTVRVHCMVGSFARLACTLGFSSVAFLLTMSVFRFIQSFVF